MDAQALQPITAYVTLTSDEWDDQYAPMNNPFEKDIDLFETYGDALEFINRMPAEHVWTQVDGDDGGVYIVNGRHFVNRIGYYFTARPHDPNSLVEVCVIPPDCEKHTWVKVESRHVASGINPEGLGNVCDKCDVLQSDLEDEDE